MEEPAPSRPVNIEEHLSCEGRATVMGGLRKLVTGFAGQPGIICVHGGLPPASSFPIKAMTMTLGDGRTLVIDDPAKLAAAQQYCMVTAGYAPLHAWIKRHMALMHTLPGDHDIIITPGNNQTIEVVFRLLLDRGDAVLCEEYTYPHIAESLVVPQGFRTVPLAMDGDGIIPGLFRRTLEAMRADGARLPRLLYTVPVGQNPTGAITPLERRREIYAICRQYGILLLEDDPYYYLQFPVGGGEPAGFANLGVSYLSLDTDSRVIRLDSFSKVLAPGLRIGWVTAPPALLDRIIFHMQGVQLGANSFTQVAIAEILEAWGDEGFEAHVREMQREYCQRAATIQAAAEEHLSGLAEWRAPRAGMFLWLRLLRVRNADEILEDLKAAGVVVVPGRFSHCCGPRHEERCPYVRVSFACATPAELREGMARLGAVLRTAEASPDAAAPAAAADINGLVAQPGSTAEDAPTQPAAHTLPQSAFRSEENGSSRHAPKPAAAANRAADGRAAAAAAARAALQQEDSAMHTAMAGLRVGASEVMPGCRANVALVAGSPGLSADALAPLPAKTMAHVASGHLGSI